MAELCFNGVDSNVRWTALVIPPRLDERTLNRMLPMLVAMNEDWLREFPQMPRLYDTHVAYVRDEPGREQWVSAPWVFLRGYGDCKSLSAWRAAELRVAGEDACCFVPPPRQGPRGLVYHVQVRRGDGRIEDPSIRRGMGWAEPGVTPEIG